jgi:hypothetical protein
VLNHAIYALTGIFHLIVTSEGDGVVYLIHFGFKFVLNCMSARKNRFLAGNYCGVGTLHLENKHLLLPIIEIIKQATNKANHRQAWLLKRANDKNKADNANYHASYYYACCYALERKQ